MNNLRIWPKITSVLLAPKLPLGNGVFEAPASRRTAKQELARKGFPSRSFTAIKLSRHTGMDCRYPEHRDVNLSRPPWHLGSGIPRRNDGFFLNLMAVKLLLGNPYLASSCLAVLREAGASKPHSQAGAWERATRKLFSAISLLQSIVPRIFYPA